MSAVSLLFHGIRHQLLRPYGCPKKTRWPSPAGPGYDRRDATKTKWMLAAPRREVLQWRRCGLAVAAVRRTACCGRAFGGLWAGVRAASVGRVSGRVCPSAGRVSGGVRWRQRARTFVPACGGRNALAASALAALAREPGSSVPPLAGRVRRAAAGRRRGRRAGRKHPRRS